ncbi:MAG: hypothetical protein AB7I27_02755 [Bacteriovoracaceae bacterium]
MILPFLLMVLSLGSFATETFVIQIDDRSMTVHSIPKSRSLFSVIVENRSLTDQVGKFTAASKNLKFVAVKAGKSETVEIENKISAPVYFVPLSPAFQNIELVFGKKTYEIPSKE